MGLDIVELFITVEERFGVSFSDEEAQTLTTPGRLTDSVMKKIHASDKASCISQRAFHFLRRHAIQAFKISRHEFLPESRLEDIVPKAERRHCWSELHQAVGASHWPELDRPPVMIPFLVALPVAATVLATILWRQSTSWNLVPSVWAGVATGIITGFLGALATRPFRIRFPSGHSRVRDLVQFMIARNPDLIPVEQSQWTRERVWCVVRDIVMQFTGPVDVTEDSDFVEDLRLG